MPRFYFHLISRSSRIPDDVGKELSNSKDACRHARKLIEKIQFHVGYDDASEWNVIISNNVNEQKVIVPFPISGAMALGTGIKTSKRFISDAVYKGIPDKTSRPPTHGR